MKVLQLFKINCWTIGILTNYRGQKNNDHKGNCNLSFTLKDRHKGTKPHYELVWKVKC